MGISKRSAVLQCGIIRAFSDLEDTWNNDRQAIQNAAEVAARHGMTVNNLRQLKYRLDRMISAVEAEYGM